MTSVPRSRRPVPLDAAAAPEAHFDYVVRRQRRKTLALHVLADATVEVRAPRWVPRRAVAAFVEERVEWVVAQRRQALQKLALKPHFGDGGRHLFLGQHYPLAVRCGARAGVYWEDGQVTVTVRDRDDPQQVRRALERWYRRRAAAIYEERLFACFEAFPDWFQDRYPMPALKIRKMRRRWGSCSSRGEITLNLALVQMPVSCIDYVICHELCHLEAFDHGRAFYRLLAGQMPDWRQRETLIEQFADHIG